MHKEAIDERTKRVWDKIAKTGIAGRFYLAGGTALAVHFGHRKSIDLDFFSQEDFSTPDLRRQLSQIGEIVLLGEADGTLHVTIDHVMVSFFRYGYGLLFSPVKFEGLTMADERDIALAELIDFFEKKYAGIQYNMLHILKSLIYFDDADGEPPPLMLRDADWDNIKQSISQAVAVFSKERN
jgi:hypothetical protein